MTIFLLECRNNRNGFESDLSFVGSSLEKCFDFIKDNPKYDEYPYWWCIFGQTVDDPNILNINWIGIYDEQGRELNDQPIDGTKEYK